MTLIFSGNDFKYELEGVMKLFIPAKLFSHEFTDRYVKVEGDAAFFRRRKGKRYTLLYVYVTLGSKTCYRVARIQNAESDYENECELTLSRLLFSVMSELTGKQAKWGIITGIRPVKRVNKMLSNDMTKDQIYDIMRNRYLCDNNKIDIAYKTAKTQSEILSDLDNKSFSLYVSIPFCPTRCSYCSFVSQSIEGCLNLIPEYVDNLCREIEYTAEIVKRLGLVLDTVYFGGGTPTTLEADMLDKLMKTIAGSFDLSNLREYTVEAGRADTITCEKLKVLKKNGCNRISINPQTLNDSVLERIGRKHTAEQFLDSYKLAKSIGFESVNTDIIAGLPTDTLDSFKNTVDKLIQLEPENITVHTLSIKRAARLNQEENDEVFDNPASKMVDYATKRLLENGYLPYYLYRQKNMLDNLENIGWCKPNKESLYNIYIMEEVQTILAVGAGGSTKLVDLKNDRIERIFNYKFPLEYNKHFDLMIKKKDEIEGFYSE
ncbi:MAG: coproporphyrinogen dehydrogenase HemZ [Ruminococcus sp.]|nr:coproporphyrinogen dehydrogenase HemZ [Ruminococcus sp.]